LIQLFGQSATAVAPGEDGPTPSTGVRAFATPANADRALFHLDLRRSLGMHRRLVWTVVLTVGALAVLYFMGEAMVPKPWPAYKSESIVDVRPTPTMILPNPGSSERWPFDSNTFETYIQRQMTNVSRNEVLIAALHKLTGFQHEGEGDQAAAQRLASRLEVKREGSAYRFSISARAESPAMAAQIANAVTAAYIESPTRDAGTGEPQQRLQMWKEERDRIQSALAADRTEQDALNRHLQILGEAATSATGEMQRSSELTADIARLQARYAVVDEELRDLKSEDGAPAAAYQVTPAASPPGLTKSGVLRNALLIAVAGLFLGVLAAVCVHKLDPRVYTGADVERVLGFAPLAQLPDFNEVSDGAAEEYTLRLAAAIEQGREQDNLKNCIFTGTGSETGVSTLVNRVAAMLEAMGRPTVLVDATGARAPAPRGRDGGQALAPVERLARSTALPRKGGETETWEDSLVVADTAPLAVSAETEYLARFADCAIVVIASGVTTRAELREAARTFERLKVAAVGFVLNRVGLEKADAAFRKSVEGVERQLRIYGKPAAIRNERQGSFAADRRAGREALAGAAAHISLSVAADAGVAALPRPVAPTAAASPLPAAQEEPFDPAVALAPQTEPEAVEEPKAERAATKQVSDVPLWLIESIRNRAPGRPPPLQPEKLWTARRPSTDEVIEVAAQSLNVDPQRFKRAFEQWRDRLPSLKETPRTAPAPRPQEASRSDFEDANGNLDPRLSALKNLLSVLEGKDGQSGEESGEHYNGGGASFDSRSEWTIPEDGASRASGASPGMVTAPAEFILPKAPVAEFEAGDGPVGESSTRQGRRTAADAVQILPSMLG